MVPPAFQGQGRKLPERITIDVFDHSNRVIRRVRDGQEMPIADGVAVDGPVTIEGKAKRVEPSEPDQTEAAKQPEKGTTEAPTEAPAAASNVVSAAAPSPPPPEPPRPSVEAYALSIARAEAGAQVYGGHQGNPLAGRSVPVAPPARKGIGHFPYGSKTIW